MYDGRVVFEIDADTKNFDNQIEKVEEELNDLLNRYEETQQMKPFKGKDEDLRNLGIEIEKTANKLKGLRAQQQATQQESKKTGTSISKSFEKGLKSVKKLALGIIGIRSAYMLARRAASAYMSQDEELTKKVQSAWVGLGAFLAPFLEWFSEIMLKAVGYLNEFIKALTGNDYIARANAKALEKQAKAQSNLNKEMQKYQQYDFDVIRTQQDMSSYNVGSSSGETSGLIDIPELNEKIVKKLQDLAKWLKENKDLIEEIGIALGITFGAVAIGNLLANIGALIGSGTLMTGLLGLLTILGLLAVAWTIKIIIENLDELEDAYKKMKYIRGEAIDTEAQKIDEIIANRDRTAANEWQKTNTKTEKSLDWYYSQYYQWLDAKEKYKEAALLYGAKGAEAFGFKADYEGTWGLYEQELKNVKSQITTLVKLGKAEMLTAEGYEDLATYVAIFGGRIGELNDSIEEYYIDQNDLNDTMQLYATIYPNVIDKINYFDDAQKQQIKTTGKLTNKLEDEKNAVNNLGNSVNDLPKEHNINLNATDNATSKLNWVKYIIDSVPKETDTKIEANTKDAEENVTSLTNFIRNLPTQKNITVDIKTRTDELKEKVRALANITEILMPGISGTMAKNSLLRSLDWFATGGYVSQPTLAVVGEGRTRGEYMIPDGEDYISRLAAEIGQYSGGNGVTNIYLDGRLIQRQISKTEQGIRFTQNR